MVFRLKDKPKWLIYCMFVVIIHLVGIGLLLTGLEYYPQISGYAFLAYTLGLRHAFDIDHIASIDNTVRKLVQQKKEPAGVGFFFSLGHSSVVFIMSIVTAFSMKWISNKLPQMREIGGVVGTAVSGSFLIIIGLINLYIWIDIFKFFIGINKVKLENANLDKFLLNRGFISRFLKPLYKLINKSWHVYPIGFLFGLGFDTASEVALLAISVNAAAKAMPISLIIALPVLFAAGMSLMDTIDGIFMTNAYNWAFATPIRKIYYNLSVTGLSVIAALFIGFIELAQILTKKLELSFGIWRWIRDLDFSGIGYILVVLFVFTWVVSYIFWKMLRLKEV